MNKCKGVGALKYPLKYNINKQVNLITITLTHYIAWKNGK